MKKVLLFALAILTVMSMLFVMPASPAAAAGEKSIKLISVEFIQGKGMTLKFEVKGKFNSYDGFVILGGDSYPLNCRTNDDGLLVCSAPEGLKRFVGKGACGEVNGFPFCGQVRLRALTQPTYCYSIFDWKLNEPGWEQQGTYCQAVPAEEGDGILWYNPVWEGWYYYWYSLDGTGPNIDPFTPNLGPGYYYGPVMM